MALYFSYPAVSQICAFIYLPSTMTVLAANSTPIVGLASMLNSFLVNLESTFDFPTPESPFHKLFKQNQLFSRDWLEYIHLHFILWEIKHFLTQKTAFLIQNSAKFSRHILDIYQSRQSWREDHNHHHFVEPSPLIYWNMFP